MIVACVKNKFGVSKLLLRTRAFHYFSYITQCVCIFLQTLHTHIEDANMYYYIVKKKYPYITLVNRQPNNLDVICLQIGLFCCQ